MKRGIGILALCCFLCSCTLTVKQAVMPRSGDNIKLVKKGSFTFSEEEERFIYQEAKNFGIPVPDREEIRRYIWYFLQNKPYLERTLQRAEYYLPLIKPIIEKSGLPSELALLPVIESGFNPLAVSRSGAAGLWQFIPSTAKRYGLRVDEQADERFDVVKSTEAAVRYLKDLYNMFGSWELALAAYNCGENCVKNKTAGVDFWLTKDMLPVETRNYVPAFFAVLLLTRDPLKYGLSSPEVRLVRKEEEPVRTQFPIDTQDYRKKVITLENGAKLIIKE